VRSDDEHPHVRAPVGEAGLRTLPWTGMPMIVAPFAGMLSDRIGAGR
jgi:hypothetical protein